MRISLKDLEKKRVYPSGKPEWTNSKNVSHLLPTTFPQVKHLIGMIISVLILRYLKEKRVFSYIWFPNFLNLFSLDRKGRVNLKGKFLNFIHRRFEYFKFFINFANVILHIPYSIDTADELGVVLKDKRLNFMIMDFDFLINLIIFPDQLLDRVLLYHVEHVPLGVKVRRVDVHWIFCDLNFIW